jgi:hypothetical protein
MTYALHGGHFQLFFVICFVANDPKCVLWMCGARVIWGRRKNISRSGSRGLGSRDHCVPSDLRRKRKIGIWQNNTRLVFFEGFGYIEKASVSKPNKSWLERGGYVLFGILCRSRPLPRKNDEMLYEVVKRVKWKMISFSKGFALRRHQCHSSMSTFASFFFLTKICVKAVRVLLLFFYTFSFK